MKTIPLALATAGLILTAGAHAQIDPATQRAMDEIKRAAKQAGDDYVRRQQERSDEETARYDRQRRYAEQREERELRRLEQERADAREFEALRRQAEATQKAAEAQRVQQEQEERRRQAVAAQQKDAERRQRALAPFQGLLALKGTFQTATPPSGKSAAKPDPQASTTVTPPVPLTDQNLAAATRLIQAGKADEGRRMIAGMIAASPADARVPQLRALLRSLDAGSRSP